MSVKKCVERNSQEVDERFGNTILEILKTFDEDECKGCFYYKNCRKIVEDERKEDIGFQHTMRDLFAENEQQA